MSDGYRNGAFALGLVVGGGLALNLFLWLDYRAQQQPDHATHAQDNTDYSQIGNYWDGFIGTFVSPSDTIAQWIMAVFTIAATVVLVYTLRSANNTNQAAVKAASAALEANQILRDEQRPYLSYNGGKIRILSVQGVAPNEGILEVDIAFRNCGQTPGVITRVSSAIYAPVKGKSGWRRVRTSGRNLRVAIGPNQVDKVRFDAISADENGEYSWFMAGISIWYESLTGDIFEDGVWLTFDGKELRQDYSAKAHGFELYRPYD